MGLEVWLAIIGVIGTLVTTVGGVMIAKINREHKPIRDVLKKTRIEGDGSLIEALSILQQQYRDSQQRARDEIKYYYDQAMACRKAAEALQLEFDQYREQAEAEIASLKDKVKEHEDRLNQSHIGQGK